MEVKLVPILNKLREIYNLNSPMDRYNSYVKLMTQDAGEIYPLGDFSPMGQRQKQYLDELLQLDAEKFANETCVQVSRDFDSDLSCRVMLVVLDEPKNGWTQRCLTEARWRFDALPPLRVSQGGPSQDVRPWVPVDLWTADVDYSYQSPSLEYVSQQVRGAIFRADWKMKYGVPKSLREVLIQEGSAMTYSGERVDIGNQDLLEIKDLVEAVYDTTHYPTIFSFMYGDKSAKAVGYEPLGVPGRGGFALARALCT